jgi:UDP-N-acetylmuramyl pentapeptide phosphotransferase/UDP-N-acetylglucosamine-1-phosphate transferase
MRDFGVGVLASLVALAVAASAGSGVVRVPAATNHRGRRVPLSLGLALAAGYGVLAVASALGLFCGGFAGCASTTEWLWLLLAMSLVFAAGLYDDRQRAPVHGVRAHFGALAHGRVTSGIVKVVAALAAATIVVVSSGAGGAALPVAILLVAGTTNLVNVLDVVPGRALKFVFSVAILLLVIETTRLGWATAGQAGVLLPFDVRERGMLGDAGANLLGFVLGVVAFQSLSTTWMTVALVIVLLLNALAETVTLTRLIRAAPPLRWVDDLWRVPTANPTAG